MGESAAGSIQPPESVAGNISYFCHVSFYTPNHVFQNFVILLQFCSSWWSCCFIYAVFYRPNMNLNYLYLFLSQPSVIWGLWERRFHSNMFGALAGSEPHQEPSSQEKVFYWGMFWFVLCFPHPQHLERAFDSITPFSWTTRTDSTHELCFFHSKKSWPSKTTGSSPRRSWWFEDTPRLKLGEAGAVYVDMNVVVGPSATLWPWSHPLPPQHMTRLSSVEEGGGEEWNWYGAM